MIALVEVLIQWLNYFPSSNRLSDTMSPATIVIGNNSPDLNQKIIIFGAYAMVYIGTKKTMKRRIVPDIALNELNEWVGHNFMSFYSVKRLHSH